MGRVRLLAQRQPDAQSVETTLASLEAGCGALAFASGMAATHCVTMLLQAGDHILAGADIYGGTYRLLHKIMNRSGIACHAGRQHGAGRVRRALHTRRRNWSGSRRPGNPRMTITDIAACAEMAHRHGALLGVDNTFATPVLTRPLELGADIVMHSATKYLGGHSDLLGGALVVRDPELLQAAVLHPERHRRRAGPVRVVPARPRLEDAGTARARAERHGPATGRVAGRRPAGRTRPVPRSARHIPAMRWPHGRWTAAFGGHAELRSAGRLRRRPSGWPSRPQLFQLAVSLGAVESLIEQPASMSHASYDPADRQRHGITDGLIRLSVGLEDFDDLRRDLDQAFGSVAADNPSL